ncbi:orotidine-5'-phosphate decarboxylase [bacterium]|nr:orotidine-5'-phosphate decarboxylase [bacterium]
MEHFADRLLARMEATGSIVCVGLDPRPDWLPEELRSLPEASREFCAAVLDLARGRACAIKPQLAFFDDEPAAPEALARAARPDLLSVADAKRGDIGTTAEAYAARWLGARSPFDALTVNPFLGRDSLEPFVSVAEKEGRGVFVLVKTSNKGAADFQDLRLASGELVFEAVARLVSDLGKKLVGESGFSLVGAVVGATAPPDVVARLRELMPRAIFLMPGYGAQGGSERSIARALDGRGRGVLVPSSRALTFPWRAKDSEASAPADWRKRIIEELDRTNAVFRAERESSR